MATSDCVHTKRLHVQDQDCKNLKSADVEVTCEWILRFFTLNKTECKTDIANNELSGIITESDDTLRHLFAFVSAANKCKPALRRVRSTLVFHICQRISRSSLVGGAV